MRKEDVNQACDSRGCDVVEQDKTRRAVCTKRLSELAVEDMGTVVSNTWPSKERESTTVISHDTVAAACREIKRNRCRYPEAGREGNLKTHQSTVALTEIQ